MEDRLTARLRGMIAAMSVIEAKLAPMKDCSLGWLKDVSKDDLFAARLRISGRQLGNVSQSVFAKTSALLRITAQQGAVG